MGVVFGTHWMKPHCSLSVTTPYVRISGVIVRMLWTALGRIKIRTKLATTGLRLRLELLVDDSVETHDPRVLTKVVFGLAQEVVRLTVTSYQGDLLGPGERSHDIDVI